MVTAYNNEPIVQVLFGFVCHSVMLQSPSFSQSLNPEMVDIWLIRTTLCLARKCGIQIECLLVNWGYKSCLSFVLKSLLSYCGFEIKMKYLILLLKVLTTRNWRIWERNILVIWRLGLAQTWPLSTQYDTLEVR